MAAPAVHQGGEVAADSEAAAIGAQAVAPPADPEAGAEVLPAVAVAAPAVAYRTVATPAAAAAIDAQAVAADGFEVGLAVMTGLARVMAAASEASITGQMPAAALAGGLVPLSTQDDVFGWMSLCVATMGEPPVVGLWIMAVDAQAVAAAGLLAGAQEVLFRVWCLPPAAEVRMIQ